MIGNDYSQPVRDKSTLPKIVLAIASEVADHFMTRLHLIEQGISIHEDHENESAREREGGGNRSSQKKGTPVAASLRGHAEQSYILTIRLFPVPEERDPRRCRGSFPW